MKFTIDKQVFLGLVDKVVPLLNVDIKALKANSMIQFEMFPNGIMLSTFSIEANIKAFQGNEIEGPLPPAFGVEGKILIDLLKAMPNGNITFTTKDENIIKVSSGKKSSNLKIVIGDFFPLAPNYDNFKFQSAPGLFTKIDSVMFAASTAANETRVFLKCVYLNEEDVVGTNGFRMAINKHGLSIQGNFLLPVELISKIGKTFRDTEEEKVAIAFDGESNYIHFRLGHAVASIRTVAKDYVQYQRILPVTPFDHATVNKAELLKSLGLVSVLSESMNSVNMDFDNTSLKIHTNNQNLGDVEDFLEIDYNKQMKLSLDSSYLEDVLKRVSGDTIQLEIRGELSPIVVRDQDYVHVVMPKKRI